MHKIKIPFLKFRYHLIFNDNCHDGLTDNGFYELYERMFDNPEEAERWCLGANAMTLTLDNYNYFVMILPNNPKPGVVAHECFHMAKIIMELKATPLSDDTDEMWAHLIDLLVENVYRHKPELE